MNAFVTQYNYNTQLDVTLKLLCQNFGETFVDFLSHWRGKVAKMTNRPTEMEQMQIVVKNLQGSIKKHLIVQPLATFQQLYAAGIQVEDAIRSGILDREDFQCSFSQKIWQQPFLKPQLQFPFQRSQCS